MIVVLARPSSNLAFRKSIQIPCLDINKVQDEFINTKQLETGYISNFEPTVYVT
jgi:hypothetical protein